MYYPPRRSNSGILVLGLLLPIALVIGLASGQMLRSVPAIQATITYPPQSILGVAPQAELPSAGASIVAVEGLGTLTSAGQTTPRPIASVTKMMTAYVVLKGHPLRPGETGPTLTLTAADASRYREMFNQDQSVLQVTAGMRLSQLELLQGLLVASANNFAEILAVWDAGSLNAFVAKMNAEAKALGMNATTYADASGFSSASVSTPSDLMILARKNMTDPVFASIVAMKQIALPSIGVVKAVNELVGEGGVIGIKTGFTEDAGGNLVFAAQRPVGSQTVTVLGAVMGQTNRPQAFAATRRVLDAVYRGLQLGPALPQGQVVATLKPAWGDAVNVVAGEAPAMLIWPGMTLDAAVELDALKAPRKAGEQVGVLKLRLGEQERLVPLILAKDVEGAGLLWRLTRF